MLDSPILINKQQLTNLPKDLYIPPNSLKVFLDMFEGPLDLLLYLIRRQNLNIEHMPIAKITEQYMIYINAMQELNIELASEYLLMAAILLEIKSRILLPVVPSPLSDEAIETDPRQELIKRLLEYEKIKLASQNLKAIPEANRDYLWLNIELEAISPELPTVLIQDLHQAWNNLLLRNLQAHTTHTIKKQELSLREYMSQILKQLSKLGKTNFYNLFKVEHGISYLVINFLAILELGKDGLIKFNQDNKRNIFIELAK